MSLCSDTCPCTLFTLLAFFFFNSYRSALNNSCNEQLLIGHDVLYTWLYYILYAHAVVCASIYVDKLSPIRNFCRGAYSNKSHCALAYALFVPTCSVLMSEFATCH